MEKYIGGIRLNFDFYKGNDLYSDGEVEDELLDIVKNNSEYEDIIKEKKEWAITYHLSKIRGNIVEWIPIEKTDSVLEIGAGCGAITGILAKKSKKVDCIELSQKRSYINAYRNREKNNINIFLGNFEDIEKSITIKYDYITLIGVFEYAESYINSQKPYIEFLRIIKKHLNKNGKIIIAIENRLGLKYWAGCKEDHLGTYFEGLEGYMEAKGVKTFSKNELEDIFKTVGFNGYNFYYPYPDYKLPTTIYSDEYLPKLGELNNNFRNFDLDRVITFNETKVFDSIIKNNLFPIFSNSYLIILE
ncbi:class I SAM-dependent methyltransferase [Clostridioides difficile]|nr:class I SAM-dependent methyltransferase [Clostridioides difficile]